MLDTNAVPDLVNDYRHALEVMEEHSHLGLDDEAASKLREILQRHIRDTEPVLSCRPVSPVLFPFEREKIAK